MNKIATLLNVIVTGNAHPTRLYRLDPPIAGHHAGEKASPFDIIMTSLNPAAELHVTGLSEYPYLFVAAVPAVDVPPEALDRFGDRARFLAVPGRDDSGNLDVVPQVDWLNVEQYLSEETASTAVANGATHTALLAALGYTLVADEASDEVLS